jgi:trans-2,3-dihydro-3-hydroxyanthranilate isomerase
MAGAALLAPPDREPFMPRLTPRMPSMRTYRYVLCDVFTDRPLTGNPLAVFTDGRGLDAATQQGVARELNLSETVFVFPPEAGGHARIRIFTPHSEMQFAGHPMLGTAFVLGGPLQSNEVRLETGKGVIPVRLEREGPRVVYGRMEQPLPEIRRFAQERELLDALGVNEASLPIGEYDNGPRHLIVVLDEVAAVSALAPDLRRLARFSYTISVAAGSGERFSTRVFAPAFGIPEDPATGSAAGPLAFHLARHGRARFGEEITFSQGVEMGRPAELVARVDGSAERLERVEVGGAAIVFGRGELRL